MPPEALCHGSLRKRLCGCPALSSEPGLAVLADQVVRGTVGSPMVGDELPAELAPFEKETLLTPAIIIATASDRDGTVRERDPEGSL